MELTDEMRKKIKGQLTSAPSRKSHAHAYTYRFNHGRAYASDALGVHPSQIEDARKALRDRGVNVDFAADGRVLIESDRQYRDIGRATGMYNGRDGWEQADQNGRKIATGRSPVQRREEARQALRRWCDEGI